MDYPLLSLMKIIALIIIVTLLFGESARCQNKNINLIAGGGLSKHGTGDLPGYCFFNQVDITLNKHFFLSPGIQFTNHSQTYILSSQFAINYVTAGINIFTTLNYFILNKSRHRIAFGAGPLVRFENSSVPSEVGINLGSSGEQVLILKNDKLRSTSVGYHITPTYYYQCCNKLSLGAKLIFQNDTKGDVIISESVFVGIKL